MANIPLNALRIFEVAARHPSYTQAAAELHLTHGAISHQMRSLEEDLGQVLFERDGRRMRLTSVGADLAREVHEGLGRLTRAYEQVKDRARSSAVTVSVLASFASRWLVPRLSRFYQLHPEVDVSLRVSDELANFRTDGVDLAIRFGAGRWSGTTAIELIREESFPVASPAYLKKHRLKTPADLGRASLLRNTYQPWVPWFRSMGLDLPEPSRGTLFDDSLTALKAAAEGHGVALARGILAIDELESGRLCRLFSGAVPLDWAYYAVYLGEGAPPPRVEPFLRWLQVEAAAASRARGRDQPPYRAGKSFPAGRPP